MKLFIINKKAFEDLFPEDGNSYYKNSKQIHKEAFQMLQLSINVHNAIPLCLTPSYKTDGVVLLDFLNKKGDIYFYEFTTTAS